MPVPDSAGALLYALALRSQAPIRQIDELEIDDRLAPMSQVLAVARLEESMKQVAGATLPHGTPSLSSRFLWGSDLGGRRQADCRAGVLTRDLECD
jgi:hypothetical protein